MMYAHETGLSSPKNLIITTVIKITRYKNIENVMLQKWLSESPKNTHQVSSCHRNVTDSGAVTSVPAIASLVTIINFVRLQSWHPSL